MRLAVVPLLAISWLIPLLSGCTAAQVSSPLDPLVGTCYNGKCLTYKTWGKNIDAAINGKAVGYAYRIVHNGILTTASNAFGQARTAADPPVTVMSLYEPFNIASVTKTLTAVAVLRLLAAKQIKLGSSIAPYLPPDWQLGPGVSDISFAELLTHTSGIQVPKNVDDIGYNGLKALMGQTIDQGPTGYKQGCINLYHQGKFARCYTNTNFALFRIIIPYIRGDANPIPPASLQPLLSLSTDIFDHEVDSATAQDYLSYMNSLYSSYSPIVPISCTPQGSSRMLSYPYPGPFPGAGLATDWDDWLPKCGAGGIQLSADQMATFLSNLMSGAYIALSSSDDPYDPYSTTLFSMWNNMYGWDYRFPTTTYGVCVAKNGDLGATNTNNKVYVPYVTTLIVYCPTTGLAFAGLANSRLGSAQSASYGFIGSWDDIVINAYTASWQ